ncbi:DUF1573 domain-containing protein [Chitinophaga filiformis]|uniref:DUF1573 domain-containing protein n=1 Tax=Chitinophaga filiformis TaxID=104663 RepID=A0A1G7Y846_CHIFI|nr:DUF1573 domain-containing protein [Chitinophaga filiformis]SDG92544.1 Protein of unknown function [Chitinophaga filiformis]
MKPSLYPILIITVCLFACQPVTKQAKDNIPTCPADSFLLSPEVTVTNQQGKKEKLSDVLVKDSSTLVVRVTDNHPDESKHIALYRLRFITDEYPPTKNIIILADRLPADTGWGQLLKTASFKVRVFQIDSSLLPPALEQQQRAYLFYLNKQLHASKVYVPDSLYGSKTDSYFEQAGLVMGRTQVNSLLVHTKGMRKNSYYRSGSSNTDIYLSDRFVKVGPRNIYTRYYEDFYFRNTGREPLVIYKTSNNWGCTGCEVYVPAKPVQPGERDRIRVYYRPRQSGLFRNEIRVYSNTPGSPHTLIISGTAVNSSGRTTTIGFSRYKRF